MTDLLDEVLAEAGVDKPTSDTTPASLQRENLRVLAAAGTSVEFLGKPLALGDVERMSDDEVSRMHARYEAIFAQRLRKQAIGGVLRVACKMLGFLLPHVGYRLSVTRKHWL
ncbi:hypothetical protein QZH41_000493 [Actinostola sp. cb2023]|nr:hypothetical protein QZH41_000493 [Actinostola sp. cb2023]